MSIKLKPGDIVEFVQEDGERITLLVRPDGIGVKAELPWTRLDIHRDSSFFVKAVAVKR